MKSCAVFLKCFFFLFFGFQLMHIDDPLTFGPAPSSARIFGSMILSPSSQCSQCAGYSSRIFDDKVSSLTAKILHHEECDSFVLGIIEFACEMLRYKFPFDLSSSPLPP
jgi:hypothetical protein